jgi:hypothetical protein
VVFNSPESEIQAVVMVSVATGNPKLQTLKRPPTMGYQFRVSPSNYTCNYQIYTQTIPELSGPTYEESTHQKPKLHSMHQGIHFGKQLRNSYIEAHL